MAGSPLQGIANYRAVDATLATSGLPTAAQMGAIARAGFSTVINLAPDAPGRSLPDEAGLVESLGLRYVHVPVPFGAPAREQLVAFLDAMGEHEGERVWVHCVANMRVSAFVGLHRVLRLGWEREPAFALMRDVWEPNPVWSEFIDGMLEQRP